MTFIAKLFESEEAQATTEYIMILAMAVSFVVLVTRNLLKPFFLKYSTKLAKSFDDRLFSPASMHSINIGK